MARQAWIFTLICASTLAGDRPSFEVASIKPCNPSEATGPVRKSLKTGRAGGGAGRVTGSPGRLVAECRTVASLIVDAYAAYPDGKSSPNSPTTGLPTLPISQRLITLLTEDIKGASGWVTSNRYTIEARASGPQTIDMMRGPLMRTLLEDRFRLKLHKEARAYPTYELTVAKTGVKLDAAIPGDCVKIDLEHPPQPPSPGQPPLCGAVRMAADGQHLQMSGITLDDFCRQFSVMLDREVVNKAALAGVFDLTLTIAAEDLGFPPRDRDPAVPLTRPDPDTMFAAVRGALQKVGLKLEPGKGSAEFMVIDSIERPSEN